MITYPLHETLEDSVVKLAIEHESDYFPAQTIQTTVPVAEVILTDGTRAQVQLLITTEEDDFIEPEEALTILDMSAGKEFGG